MMIPTGITLSICMHCVYLVLWTCTILCESFLCAIYKFLFIHSCISLKNEISTGKNYNPTGRDLNSDFFWEKSQFWFLPAEFEILLDFDLYPNIYIIIRYNTKQASLLLTTPTPQTKQTSSKTHTNVQTGLCTHTHMFTIRQIIKHNLFF